VRPPFSSRKTTSRPSSVEKVTPRSNSSEPRSHTSSGVAAVSESTNSSGSTRSSRDESKRCELSTSTEPFDASTERTNACSTAATSSSNTEPSAESRCLARATAPFLSRCSTVYVEPSRFDSSDRKSAASKNRNHPNGRWFLIANSTVDPWAGSKSAERYSSRYAVMPMAG
jgi:hypothetical protein